MRASAFNAFASFRQTFLHTGFMIQRSAVRTRNRNFSNADFLSTFRTFTVRCRGKRLNQRLTAIRTKHACSRLWKFKTDFFVTLITSNAYCHDLKMVLNEMPGLIRFISSFCLVNFLLKRFILNVRFVFFNQLEHDKRQRRERNLH